MLTHCKQGHPFDAEIRTFGTRANMPRVPPPERTGAQTENARPPTGQPLDHHLAAAYLRHLSNARRLLRKQKEQATQTITS
jgi:hypothetical protein